MIPKTGAVFMIMMHVPHDAGDKFCLLRMIHHGLSSINMWMELSICPTWWSISAYYNCARGKTKTNQDHGNAWTKRGYSSQVWIVLLMSSQLLNRLLVDGLLSRLFSAQNKLLPHYRTACCGGYESWRSMNLCICNPGHGSWFYKVPWFSQ